MLLALFCLASLCSQGRAGLEDPSALTRKFFDDRMAHAVLRLSKTQNGLELPGKAPVSLVRCGEVWLPCPAPSLAFCEFWGFEHLSLCLWDKYFTPNLQPSAGVLSQDSFPPCPLCRPTSHLFPLLLLKIYIDYVTPPPPNCHVRIL